MCMYTHIYIRIHVYLIQCICKYKYAHIYISLCIFVCMHIHGMSQGLAARLAEYGVSRQREMSFIRGSLSL